MGCTRAQLLVLLSRLEKEILEKCQRELEDRETCERLVSPLRAWAARVAELAESEIISELF